MSNTSREAGKGMLRLRVSGIDEAALKEALESIGEIEKTVSRRRYRLSTEQPEFTVRVKSTQVGKLLERGRGIIAAPCRGIRVR